ncbi:Serine/threonine protein kinase, partial [Globisporangium splendens]
MRYFNWSLATGRARSFSERFDEAWPPYSELESNQLVFSIRVGCSLDSIPSLHQTLLHDCHRYDPSPGEPQPSARSKQLTEAHCAGHKRVVKLLLAMGVDPNAVVNGFTPLFAACVEGHVNVIKALIASGANVKELPRRSCFCMSISGCSSALRWGGVLDIAVGYQVVKLKRLLQRPPMLSDLRWTLVEMMCNYDPSRRVHIVFAVGRLYESSQQAATAAIPQQFWGSAFI